jgi:predicted enzyme related to lactoylglutathione lyase
LPWRAVTGIVRLEQRFIVGAKGVNVDQNKPMVKSQITFLYYRNLDPIAAFYENIMRFKLVEDQGWAKIYCVSGNAYLGIVDAQRGFHSFQEKNAVLVTLVVDDVPRWYEYLKSKGVKILTELQESEEIQIRCFFCEDPGGYSIEVQQFLNPDVARIFHQG